MIQRHSSRRTRLDKAVLNQRLDGASSYDRIAGYFRSSLFEVAGEAVMKVTGKVRIICNSDIDPKDMETAAAAQAALRRSWCAGHPEEAPPAALPRYRAPYEALTSVKLEVRVLPDSAFGLIHGNLRSLRGQVLHLNIFPILELWKVVFRLFCGRCGASGKRAAEAWDDSLCRSRFLIPKGHVIAVPFF
jgi:hypothetical protein